MVVNFFSQFYTGTRTIERNGSGEAARSKFLEGGSKFRGLGRARGVCYVLVVVVLVFVIVEGSN